VQHRGGVLSRQRPRRAGQPRLSPVRRCRGL